MMRALLVLAILIAPVATLAQQPPVDPALSMAKQLLAEANDRVIALGAENQRLQAALKAAQEQKDCPQGYTRNADGTCNAPLLLDQNKKP